MIREKLDLGTIRFGTRVRVSDPCYNMDTWCAGTLDNVLPGKYLCAVEIARTGKRGGFVSSLQVRHANHPEASPDEPVTGFEAGVDSGQLGFFDEEYFAENTGQKDWKNWYGEVYKITSHNMAGTLAGCSCVSLTGHGDGCYPVYVARNGNGEIVAIKAVFLTAMA